METAVFIRRERAATVAAMLIADPENGYVSAETFPWKHMGAVTGFAVRILHRSGMTDVIRENML